VGGAGDRLLARDGHGRRRRWRLAAASSLTPIDSGAVTDAVAPAWATAPGAGDARILVYDADASRARRGRRQRCRPARDAALAAASAYAQFATADAGAGALVVTIDRSVRRRRCARRCRRHPACRAHRRSDLTALTSEAAPVTLRTATAGTADDTRRPSAASARRERPASLRHRPRRPERADRARAGGDPAAPRQRWRRDDGAADAAYTDHRAQTRDTLGAVAITPPSDITLAASSAPLTFSVRNDLPWPVTVDLIATRNDPRLVVQNGDPVEAGPSQSTRVQVPVQARSAAASRRSTCSCAAPRA
jgi:hypothetical protein